MSRRILIDIALVVGAVAVGLLLRLYVVAIYRIPSESMLPRLLAGDFLLVEKWSFAAKAELPRRGDIVAFHAPPSGKRDYLKRVIALPGDTVALRNGRIVLNGRELPRWRIADLLVPIKPLTPCPTAASPMVRRERQPDGTLACRYPRYREMLPDGVTYDLIDLGPTDIDDTPSRVVPSGRLFLLGDNRDLSADSRMPAEEGAGIGLVPAEALVGRARAILFSVDGTARWSAPRGWMAAVRWERLGTRF